MITKHLSAERTTESPLQKDTWSLFRPPESTTGAHPILDSFEMFREGKLPPQTAPQGAQEAREIITYVREGSLAYQDSAGRSGVIRAGEFHRTTVGAGFHYAESNVSTTAWAHVFQIWFKPYGKKPLVSGHERRRFVSGDRRGELHLVASPDGLEGSLHLHRDCRLYSAILEPGRHLIHALGTAHIGWLYVIEGSVKLDDLYLEAGDSSTLTEELVVSLTANTDAEILLLDMGADWMENEESDEGSNAVASNGLAPGGVAPNGVAPGGVAPGGA